MEEIIIATLPGSAAGSEQADALAGIVLRVLGSVDASVHAAI